MRIPITLDRKTIFKGLELMKIQHDPVNCPFCGRIMDRQDVRRIFTSDSAGFKNGRIELQWFRCIDYNSYNTPLDTHDGCEAVVEFRVLFSYGFEKLHAPRIISTRITKLPDEYIHTTI